MREHEGRDWRTTEHETHVEYQTMIKDLVLESEYLVAGGDPSPAEPSTATSVQKSDFVLRNV